MACSPPGSSVHGILQARILEWATLPAGIHPPGDFPDLGMKPASLVSPASAGGSLPPVTPGKPVLVSIYLFIVCKVLGTVLGTAEPAEDRSTAEFST